MVGGYKCQRYSGCGYLCIYRLMVTPHKKKPCHNPLSRDVSKFRLESVNVLFLLLVSGGIYLCRGWTDIDARVSVVARTLQELRCCLYVCLVGIRHCGKNFSYGESGKYRL